MRVTFFPFLVSNGLIRRWALFSILVQFSFKLRGKNVSVKLNNLIGSGLSSLGVPWYPQILADQLTLSQPNNTGNPRFSDLPTALPWRTLLEIYYIAFIGPSIKYIDIAFCWIFFMYFIFLVTSIWNIFLTKR